MQSLISRSTYSYTMPTTTKVLKSTLANKILDNKIRDLEYKPYVDIGIVEDNVEYLLKDKGVNGAYRKEALASIEKRKGEQIIYNDLAYFKNKGIASKFVLGFMQNDSSLPELAPAWNATPVHDSNQSGKWYQDRLDKWQQNGLNLQKDITISFGPFANSFWHTAYLNNYTELDLANAFSEISNKYQTKSFDFYFAAPYNRINSEYAESTRLLAGALKILLEQDQNYQIRLSIITGNDGLVIPTPENTPYNGSKKQVGSDVYPLYEFTRFLGLNFTLNLVSAYLQPNKNNTINDRWEVPALKTAIEATHKTWKGMLSVFSPENPATQNDQLIYNRMGVTPWIGTRAELPSYKFDATDAVEIRKFALAKGMADMSMFYISRDFPSHFQANDIGNADQNPLDQNIRSGTGYEAFTYSKILSGQKIVAPNEVTDRNQILALSGALDYDRIIRNNQDLDQYTNPSDNWSGGEDSSTDPKEFWKARKNRYFSWDEANPNRLNGTTANHITTKTNAVSSTYFTPYIDNGLWEGNDLHGMINGKQAPDYTQQNVPNFNNKVNNFEALTLSFVQQVKNHNNYLDFSIAGIETGNDGYEYWEQNQLKQKVLDPLVKHKTFDKLRVSYGGLSTGHNPGENAWNVAYNKYYNENEPNMDTAVSILAERFTAFNQNLATLAGYSNPEAARANMPMSLDFDIEGAAQFTLKENRLLAKTLAFMKKNNPKWTFSLTLPVMPDGLTDICKKLVKIFIEEYQKQGLSSDVLPIINIMAMDYGDGIYAQARNHGQTNFDLAKATTISTRRNLKEIINKVYNVNINNKILNRFLGVTPMIGVNDTVEGVFTLEDAKELYNWAHDENLAFISMWSVNDDKGFNNQQPSAKTITSHGLNYLREWDFMRAFNGDWQEWVKQPARNPFKNKITGILS
ncbi:hypothetical protein [Spiroplasma sp. SV19]|uniref:hypothetical protein n=1 Tax=Spiroplasma sp. SV19 TaxID=2570468 RepID=UPI0024B73167|nr:hypothetical protein [Spiroplasma sp. SV19]WHQ36620.1 hypothetical protein E7Y35_01600 [Spiroplasma sp. SV19]